MVFDSYLETVLTEDEYKLISKLVYISCGINLGENKKEMIKTRLLKRMRFYGFKSFSEYYDYVVDDKSGRELGDLLNAITTNVTSFFREKKHFDFLCKIVLPFILANRDKNKDNKIRIWSCASATGEEIYSILISILENVKFLSGWDVKVLGTDISTKALSVAAEGIYSFDKVKNLSLALLKKYFKEIPGEKESCYKVKDILKEKAAFARLNLMDEKFPFINKFDAIFCRNVLIYFDKDTQNCLVNKLYDYLADYGYLFVGHAESLIGVKTKFKYITSAVYQKEAVKLKE